MGCDMFDKKAISENFEYLDGVLYKNNKECGLISKSKNKKYIKVWFDGKLHYAHRIIFFMHHGYVPKYIDHADNNSLNNNIENLRVATQSDNMGNSIKKRTNTSGYKGVCYDKSSGKWIAQITRNYVHKNLGRFNTPEEAFDAYQIAAKENFGNFANVDTNQYNTRAELKAFN